MFFGCKRGMKFGRLHAAPRRAAKIYARRLRAKPKGKENRTEGVGLPLRLFSSIEIVAVRTCS